MTVLLVRYRTADESVPEVVAAIEEAFAAVRERQPDGIRYAYLRRAGTAEFIGLLELEDGAENPLPGIEAARRLQATVAAHAVGDPPAPVAYELLGTYRAFD